MSAQTVAGLRVEQHQARGWMIIHEQSGIPLGPWLRLKRHAETAASEFGATGVDYTQPNGQISKDPNWKASGAVYNRWMGRARECCENGEHYSPHTWASDGRCSSGRAKPRRS